MARKRVGAAAEAEAKTKKCVESTFVDYALK